MIQPKQGAASEHFLGKKDFPPKYLLGISTLPQSRIVMEHPGKSSRFPFTAVPLFYYYIVHYYSLRGEICCVQTGLSWVISSFTLSLLSAPLFAGAHRCVSFISSPVPLTFPFLGGKGLCYSIFLIIPFQPQVYWQAVWQLIEKKKVFCRLFCFKNTHCCSLAAC